MRRQRHRFASQTVWVLLAALLPMVVLADGAVAAGAAEWVEIVVTHDRPLTGDQARGRSLDKIGVHVERVTAQRAEAEKEHWRSQPGVVDVRETVQFRAAHTPNDPVWDLQWESMQVEVDVAWDTTLGSSSVVIAVLDTGVNMSLPDFAGRIEPGGKDYVNDDNDPTDDDPFTHGTQSAMVAASGADDGFNNAGYCPNCRILPMKVLDLLGNGIDPDIADAIIEATDLGAQIINMSLGGTGTSMVLANAVAYADAAGVLMVAAAGNESSTTVNYPAGYPEVIGVAGVNLPDGGACGSSACYPMAGNEPKNAASNYGPWVSVSAPFCNVTYYTPPNGADLFCGTSSASPSVAGIAGLVLSHRPELTASQARAALQFSSRKVVPKVGGTTVAEYGRVSPVAALTACYEAAFSDVPATHPFCAQITWMAASGITSGCSGGNFCPSTDVNRGQMSAFMAKLADAATPPCTTAPFNDVPTTHPFCPHIKWMATNGITSGCGNGNFCPSTDVNRGQMSAFMYNLAQL